MNQEVELRPIFARQSVGKGKFVTTELPKMHVRVNGRWIGYIHLLNGNVSILRPVTEEERQAVSQACSGFMQEIHNSKLGSVTQLKQLGDHNREADDIDNEGTAESTYETLTYQDDD
jgi:hypothetical protein